jgi:hypothetical protein
MHFGSKDTSFANKGMYFRSKGCLRQAQFLLARVHSVPQKLRLRAHPREYLVRFIVPNARAAALLIGSAEMLPIVASGRRRLIVTEHYVVLHIRYRKSLVRAVHL